VGRYARLTRLAALQRPVTTWRLNGGRTQMPALLLGARHDVMDRALAELQRIGIEARGTTNMDTAAVEFNAREFDVVAFGGGISNDVRDRLKREFTAQNPHVRLVDVFAPVAIAQIVAALKPSAEPKLASGFEVTERNGAHVVRVDVAAECDVRVQLFQSPVDGKTVVEQRVSRGPFEIAIDDVRFAGPNIVVVTLGGREIYTSRIE
jgi:hypothetical protein